MEVSTERESLHNILRNILEEARMILPGTQTLFGFQLIVVFTEYFQNQLSYYERTLHFIAMLLTLVSFAIILSLTAYHRQTRIDLVTRKFVSLGSQLLKTGMFPLMAAIAIEFYLVTQLTFKSIDLSIIGSTGVFILLLSLWYLFPKLNSKSLN